MRGGFINNMSSGMGVGVKEDTYDVVVDVNTLTVSSVGDYTVKKIIDILDEKRVKEENKKVLLNFEGLSIIGASHGDNIRLLLSLIIEYNCVVEGLSELITEEILCYLHSDKYVADNIGSEEYIKIFKENMVKGKKNRLRVLDNFYTKDYIKKELIIDVSLEDGIYTYLRLKPCYAEPKHIIQEPFEELFVVETVHQSELPTNEYRIRERVGNHELEVMLLLDEVLKDKGIEEYIREVINR